jgi:hypothetical protein
MPSGFKSVFFLFVLFALGCTLAWGQPSPPVPAPIPASPGSISGTVFDQSGAVVAGARVKVSFENQSRNQDAVSDADGQFTFSNVGPGAFQVTITAAGFAAQTSSGTLQPGQNYIVTKIALAVASNVTDVEVQLTQAEVAQEQIKVEEKQRVLGAIPNFYVTYESNPAPMTTKQKFGLAWKTSIDPVSFVLVGAVAGLQQAQDSFDGYGQGAEGYAKRYGASYADFVTGTFIGAAILPAVLKQDPRYFYKGTGSTRSRILYAMSSAVVCKGDNGRWQANYSNILGSFAAGGISNLYYPSEDRGAVLTIENSLLGIGATAAANIFQEFVIRKLTPKLPKHDPAQP